MLEVRGLRQLISFGREKSFAPNLKRSPEDLAILQPQSVAAICVISAGNRLRLVRTCEHAKGP